MGQGSLSVRVVLAESSQNDSIGTFAVELDATVRHADDGRHALPRRVEFADVKHLILLLLPASLDEHRGRLPRLYGPSM